LVSGVIGQGSRRPRPARLLASQQSYVAADRSGVAKGLPERSERLQSNEGAWAQERCPWHGYYWPGSVDLGFARQGRSSLMEPKPASMTSQYNGCTRSHGAQQQEARIGRVYTDQNLGLQHEHFGLHPSVNSASASV
jgi:hypothetical protein